MASVDVIIHELTVSIGLYLFRALALILITALAFITKPSTATRAHTTTGSMATFHYTLLPSPLLAPQRAHRHLGWALHYVARGTGCMMEISPSTYLFLALVSPPRPRHVPHDMLAGSVGDMKA